MIADPPSSVATDLPSLLWHYTDAAGLVGIVTSGKLRFGNARFLNDETELGYGWSVIGEVLDETIADEESFGRFLIWVRSAAEALSLGNELYLCSLSERRESISQWQRYGANGRGYSIGFDARSLRQLSTTRGTPNLRKMIYAPVEQKATVQRLVAAVREQYVHLYHASDRNVRASAALKWGRHLGELSLRMKNPEFEDEREWRFIAVADELAVPQKDIYFVARDDYARPFIEATCPDDHAEPKLPIRSIVYGPKLQPKLAESSLEYLFRLSRYGQVDVQASTLIGTWR